MDKKKIHVTREYEKKMSEISPFELKNILIELADESARKSTHIMLNAGRGNPNWISTVPREAFFLLGQFALEECQRETELADEMAGAAGVPNRKRIASRFVQFLKKHAQSPGATLLKGTYEYLVTEKGVDENELVYEWAEGVIGDQYPVPDRILKYTEMLVRDYLDQELCDNQPPEGIFDLFATEGGTAAMCYIFDSLQQNFLLNKGDKIVLFAPVFTPYIEIPEQARYLFNVIEIKALKMTKDGYHTWQYQEKDLDVLKDPSVKAAFITNPSNPPSYGLTKALMNRIVEIVRNDNPNLMIITDDVYGTFVPHFRSLMYELPYNTACVYSFSKYFGATGWRLATIAIARHNVFDAQIALLPEKQRKELHDRYDSINLNPDKILFIDRLVADSRLVALNHTAGLSTPQQIQMSLFALFSLCDMQDIYKNKLQKMITNRLTAMWEKTGFKLLPDSLRAGYYSEIDIMVWATQLYGKDFAEYLEKNYEPLDFVIRLAKEAGVVVLNGDGFDGPRWSIRVSLANLDEMNYRKIGTIIGHTLEEYAQKWKNETAKKEPVIY